MLRRITFVTALAAALVGSAAFAPFASANNVAWGVAVGGPGFVVSAGQPGYWGGYRYGYGYHRHWYRPAPVVYPYGYVAPRVVYVAPPPVYYAPPVVSYGYYGR